MACQNCWIKKAMSLTVSVVRQLNWFKLNDSTNLIISNLPYQTLTVSYLVTLEAISALENVAEHINEMQNITEKFLPIFQELASVTPGLNVSMTC
jgi:hypothetical protein